LVEELAKVVGRRVAIVVTNLVKSPKFRRGCPIVQAVRWRKLLIQSRMIRHAISIAPYPILVVRCDVAFGLEPEALALPGIRRQTNEMTRRVDAAPIDVASHGVHTPERAEQHLLPFGPATKRWDNGRRPVAETLTESAG